MRCSGSFSLQWIAATIRFLLWLRPLFPVESRVLTLCYSPNTVLALAPRVVFSVLRAAGGERGVTTVRT